MTCPNCGHENNDKLYFCVRCGVRIKEKTDLSAQHADELVITPSGSGFRIPLSVPGFERRDLFIQTSFWVGPKLFVDGQKAKKVKRSYTVIDNAGKQVKIEMRVYSFDPIPRVKIDGVPLQIFSPLRWYEYCWTFLPGTLMFFGGAIGAIFGIAGAHANSRIFRSTQSTIKKYGISFLITCAAVFFWYTTSLQTAQFLRQFLPISQQFSKQTGQNAADAERAFSEVKGSTGTPRGQLLTHNMWKTISIVDQNGVEQKDNLALGSKWKFTTDGTFSKIFRDGSSLPGKWKLQADDQSLVLLLNGEMGAVNIVELSSTKLQMKIGLVTINNVAE
jgi:hypothetical protein